MNARSLVNLMLEADQMSASNRTGVYIFGQGMPPGGFHAVDLLDAFAKMEKTGFLRKGASKERGVVDWLVSTGHTFLIKVDPQNIEVIGPVPVNLTPEEQENVEYFLGMGAHDRVMHKASQFDAGKPLDVAAVLRSSKQKEQAQDTEKEPSKSARSAELAQLAKGLKAPPAAKKKPIPKVMIGIKINDNNPDIFCAEEPAAGTPAARAGFKKGDMIVGVGRFTDEEGNARGPYHFDEKTGVEDFYRVLCLAGTETVLPFQVWRGDVKTTIMVQPVAKPVRVAPAAAGQAPAAKPAMQPNAPEPTRQTGNQPANVSSLT